MLWGVVILAQFRVLQRQRCEGEKADDGEHPPPHEDGTESVSLDEPAAHRCGDRHPKENCGGVRRPLFSFTLGVAEFREDDHPAGVCEGSAYAKDDLCEVKLRNRVDTQVEKRHDGDDRVSEERRPVLADVSSVTIIVPSHRELQNGLHDHVQRLRKTDGGNRATSDSALNEDREDG